MWMWNGRLKAQPDCLRRAHTRTRTHIQISNTIINETGVAVRDGPEWNTGGARCQEGAAVDPSCPFIPSLLFFHCSLPSERSLTPHRAGWALGVDSHSGNLWELKNTHISKCALHILQCRDPPAPPLLLRCCCTLGHSRTPLKGLVCQYLNSPGLLCLLTMLLSLIILKQKYADLNIQRLRQEATVFQVRAPSLPHSWLVKRSFVTDFQWVVSPQWLSRLLLAEALHTFHLQSSKHFIKNNPDAVKQSTIKNIEMCDKVACFQTFRVSDDLRTPAGFKDPSAVSFRPSEWWQRREKEEIIHS